MFIRDSIMWEREIRNFHIAVLQRRLRNVLKREMHVQSCCFANIKRLSPFAFLDANQSSRAEKGSPGKHMTILNLTAFVAFAILDCSRV